LSSESKASATASYGAFILQTFREEVFNPTRNSFEDLLVALGVKKIMKTRQVNIFASSLVENILNLLDSCLSGFNALIVSEELIDLPLDILNWDDVLDGILGNVGDLLFVVGLALLIWTVVGELRLDGVSNDVEEW